MDHPNITEDMFGQRTDVKNSTGSDIYLRCVLV